MLILTRRIGESIIIGDNVKVTVVGTKGNQVRLAVEAPNSVRIDREEIRERIDQEKLAEAGGATPSRPVITIKRRRVDSTTA